MEKKSVATSIVIIFMGVIFSVIGICFSVFVYSEKRILIEKIQVVATTGIEIYHDKNLSKQVQELKLSDMMLGLKPATGDVDSETKIPSTVNDTNSSEGYYSTVYVKANSNYKVVVKNIKIVSEKNEQDLKVERENIFVSLKNINNSTNSLEKEVVELASFSDVLEVQKLTIYVWLGAHADDVLEGAKITFDIEFIAI